VRAPNLPKRLGARRRRRCSNQKYQGLQAVASGRGGCSSEASSHTSQTSWLSLLVCILFLLLFILYCLTPPDSRCKCDLALHQQKYDEEMHESRVKSRKDAKGTEPDTDEEDIHGATKGKKRFWVEE
jgi:hypothetical protein